MRVTERIDQIGNVEYELTVRDESKVYISSWYCRADEAMTKAGRLANAYHESAHTKTTQLKDTDLPMKKCMLIPLYSDGRNFNVESKLPIIPRVGDHIELNDPHHEGKALMFRVVGVGFANEEHAEYVDVYLRPDAPLHEMISRWSKA